MFIPGIVIPGILPVRCFVVGCFVRAVCCAPARLCVPALAVLWLLALGLLFVVLFFFVPVSLFFMLGMFCISCCADTATHTPTIMTVAITNEIVLKCMLPPTCLNKCVALSIGLSVIADLGLHSHCSAITRGI